MNFSWHIKKVMVYTAIRLLKLSGWYEGYFSHWRTLFRDAEVHGLHIMPVHYYGPIPDTRTLPESLWDSSSVRLIETPKAAEPVLVRVVVVCGVSTI